MSMDVARPSVGTEGYTPLVRVVGGSLRDCVGRGPLASARRRPCLLGMTRARFDGKSPRTRRAIFISVYPSGALRRLTNQRCRPWSRPARNALVVTLESCTPPTPTPHPLVPKLPRPAPLSTMPGGLPTPSTNSESTGVEKKEDLEGAIPIHDQPQPLDLGRTTSTLSRRSGGVRSDVGSVIARHESVADAESLASIDRPPSEAEKLPPSKIYHPLSFPVLALLMPASVFGVLARLGLQAITTYDGRSIFPLAWIQAAGCLVMGFALGLKEPFGQL